MQNIDEEGLIEKLRRIEALFARPGTAGERVAAENARGRILERLAEFERVEQAIEYQFSLGDPWSRNLFIALLRRYDIAPYRHSGQRRTTVMARVTETFVNEVLWPEFQELNKLLRSHLDAVTKRIVAQAIHGDLGDAEQRRTKETAGAEAGSPMGLLE